MHLSSEVAHRVDTGAGKMRKIKELSQLQDGFKSNYFLYLAATSFILITLVDLSRI
jgi:hypothetical protein